MVAGLGFIRQPLAIVAAALIALTIAFLNDRYGAALTFLSHILMILLLVVFSTNLICDNNWVLRENPGVN